MEEVEKAHSGETLWVFVFLTMMRVFLKSPVWENCTLGSVRGLSGNWQSYPDGRARVTRQFHSIFMSMEGTMDIPEYVSPAAVQEVCQELGIRDWTKLTEPHISPEEARIIQAEVGGQATLISTDEFRQGLEVELEHGLLFPDANVTNNHPILTGKIVLAHLKEMLDYYARLEVAELEGDLLKASQAGDAEKLARKYRQLLEARAELSTRESSSGTKGD